MTLCVACLSFGLFLTTPVAAAASLGTPPPDGGAALGWYEATTWNTLDGLPQNSVLDIVQTRDGSLWLATSGGLARFDGTTFEVFDLVNEPNPGTNRIRSLHEDETGTLWIGTDARPGLLAYREGSFHPVNNAPPIRAMAPRNEGGFWAISHDALHLVVDGTLSTVWTKPQGLNDPLLSVVEGHDGKVWLTFGLLGFWDGNHFHEVFKDGQCRDACVDESGDVWVAGTDLMRFRGAEEPEVEGGRYERLLWTTDGTLWLAGEHGYTRHRSGQTSEVSAQIDGLPPDARFKPEACYHDREGNVWFGDQLRGLIRLRPCKLQSVTTANGLKEDGVFSLIPGGDGTLWVGNRQWLAQLDINTCEIIQAQQLEPSRREVMALERDREGRIWVAKGASIFRAPPRSTDFTHQFDLDDRHVRAIRQDAAGVLWFAGRKGVRRLEPGESAPRLVTSAAPLTNACALLEWPAGTMWIGLEHGLARCKDGDVDVWGRAAGMPPGAVRDLHPSPAGHLWFATYGGGLCRFDGESFAAITTTHGLLDNAISALVEDGDGYVYANTNRGVVRMPWSSLEECADGESASVVSRSFGGVPGMTSNEAQGGFQPSSCRTENGVLWFPTIEGIARLEPTRGPRDLAQPSPSIHHVSWNGRSVRVRDGRLVLPAGQRSCSFSYAAIALGHPEDTRYRVRLDGRDSTWTEVRDQRVAHYSDLPPKTYTFYVSACGHDGVWTDVPEPVVLVVPHLWYETKGFGATVALLFVGLLVVAYRVRTRGITDRARVLEQRVQQRTSELEQAREALEERVEERTHQLAAANNTLQADLAARTQLEEQLLRAQKLESIGRLAGGIAHDFNNLLTVVLGATALAQRETSNPDALRHMAEVRRAGERASKLTDQLLIFSRGKVGERRPVHLEPLLRELQGILARVLPDDIRFETNIASDLGWIHADPTQIEQVLINLSVNAGDAMPDGGVLTLKAENLPSTAAPDSTSDDTPTHGQIRLEVTDTGTGIDEATLQKVFEPFFTTKEIGKGTGLGLSVCYGIIRGLGGEISVRSRVGEGTTFEILLPRSAEAIASSDPLRESPAASQPCRILLVEDDPRVREVTQLMLEGIGCTVFSYESGRDALAFLDDDEEAIDLLLSDLVMPDLGGEEVAAEVLARRPDTHVLLMTGYAERSGTASSASAAPVLGKPFSLEQLREAVRNATATH